ncbi:MAG: hypothetical protein HUN04_23925 [Desulfobacter sp.]|nr:MAG: hypothetical protein HUN04_23925 [Desulfobacter sp.]
MDNKKLAAAMAAVYMYIRTGEEAAAASMPAPADPVPEPAGPQPVANINVWGLAGRQAIMNAGNMMQLRMFK